MHAIQREMDRTPGLKVTLPNIADEEMIRNILG
jgi:urocanate hydratase